MDNAGRATDYRYNSIGQMVAMTDANGTTDTASARTFHRRGATSGAVEHVNTYGNLKLTDYDGLGHRTSETLILTPTGSATPPITPAG